MTVDCPEEIFKQKAQTFWEVGESSDEGEGLSKLKSYRVDLGS